MNMIQQIAIIAPPLLFALTIHEYSHGYVASRLGDPTAKNMGRLTLNPLKHLDPLGVLAFIIMKIGWAKPVPVDPRYFKNPMKDMLWVALAGPTANLITAIASSLAAQILAATATFIPKVILLPLFQMIAASIWINIILAIFNLVPIPPLDGSKVLMGLLPPRHAASFARLEPFGFLILLALFYTGILQKVLSPIISFAEKIIVG
ncbi:MAG: site-2 protease family protein [Desulfobulbaceae bacterium]|uniref:Site-2 protease family protein n=1 Tax=Candidatus Desulfobia pelagia TaxID=2841692 RepID=A0A8J6NFI6_9BACT|nr:site-2 protease family protein [Candidatus Desulfobia pelagia]